MLVLIRYLAVEGAGYTFPPFFDGYSRVYAADTSIHSKTIVICTTLLLSTVSVVRHLISFDLHNGKKAIRGSVEIL